MLLSLLDILIPPRRSELLVRSMNLSELEYLDADGGLPYHDPRVTALVWECKYYKSRRALGLAGRLLSRQVLAAAAEELGRPLLVPVPMPRSRERERGHNHAELLCKSTLRHLGSAVEYRPEALTRIKEVPTQQGLSRSARLLNPKGSMSASRELVAGRSCIVVDDVTTTGATLAEARRALEEAGALRVWDAVLARP